MIPSEAVLRIHIRIRIRIEIFSRIRIRFFSMQIRSTALKMTFFL
jgi:hypothetical protein